MSRSSFIGMNYWPGNVVDFFYLGFLNSRISGFKSSLILKILGGFSLGFLVLVVLLILKIFAGISELQNFWF